jgi:hypothetical protein
MAFVAALVAAGSADKDFVHFGSNLFLHFGWQAPMPGACSTDLRKSKTVVVTKNDGRANCSHTKRGGGMSDGREEREECKKRLEQEKRENREDRIDRDDLRGDPHEWEPKPS